MPDLKINSYEQDGILWIEIGETEASIHISSKMHQKIDEYLTLGVKGIAINMGEMEFIDSSFLGVLVSALKDADTRGMRIVLFNVRPNVKAIFDLTRLDKLFPIFPDKASAQRAFI